MLTLTQRPPAGAPEAELWLDCDARQKRRQIATLADGREVRVELERLDVPLADGDLLAGDGVVVRVCARPEHLIEARGPEAALTRGAYHLGNRHAKVMLGDGCLWTPDDPVMAAMLAQLGLAVARVEAPFVPELGAYHHHGPGHEHDEAHQHGHAQAKIHRFEPEP
jgi:urease accessory protein